MNKVPMTTQGAEKLKQELQHLKTVERPRITAAIAEARAHGDLKENAEYHAAREQQSFAEGRIAEIESKLASAQVIDVTKIAGDGKVIFGATVTIYNIEDDTEVTYQIVGDDEAEIKENKISINTPIARAIIGKSSGDEVTVQAPAGSVDYEILKVQYI